jgi:DNA-directed RNA polymerase subunit B
MFEIYLNEKFIGTVSDRKQFVNEFKDKRRKGDIPESININYDEKSNEIFLDSRRGRCRRPLIIIKDGKSKLSKENIEAIKKNELKWKDLVEKGIVEYIDAGEEENCYVAIDEESITKEHTHLEISPVVILGVCTSMVPFSNFGSSSRLIRGSKIQKQSLGLSVSNFANRFDTDSSILHYPQRPIVKTFMHDIFKYNSHPSGQNFTVAVMSYEGYNMQDAIIFNKGSIQRGMGRSHFFKPYSSVELRYSGGLMDEINVPDKEIKGYKSEINYKQLEDDGVVFLGADVKTDDVIIGKTSPPRFLGNLEEFNVSVNTRRESSISIGEGNKGTVDNVILTENEEGNRLVRVRLRENRIPEIGDKFASRHGQKGIIGLLIPHEDMPFSVRGITPDIIFSPHSIPSRMTISHLLEILSGKIGSLSAKEIDATTFDTPSEDDLRKDLTELGFKEDGTERFYNPLTGKMFKARIYVGNMYYLRLRYMAANKLHARAAGRIQLLTRQPVEGRVLGGGLRLGEMEKDCLVAHGASNLLKERFDSDKTIFHVCEDCGAIAIYDSYKNKAICLRCNSSNINTVEMSYAFKLLLDELRSLMIDPKLTLKDKF